MTVTSGQKAKNDLKITGIVTDINQKPVVGATIFVDNKSTTKVTNSKGVYKLKVNYNSKSITVMSISGSMAESPIDGKTEINFSLPIDVLSGTNIVKNEKGEEDINIGYGTIKKKDLL